MEHLQNPVCARRFYVNPVCPLHTENLAIQLRAEMPRNVAAGVIREGTKSPSPWRDSHLHHLSRDRRPALIPISVRHRGSGFERVFTGRVPSGLFQDWILTCFSIWNRANCIKSYNV